MKYTGKSKSDKYKHVYKRKCKTSVNAINKWMGAIYNVSKTFKTEREAAKWVDLKLIENGKEPINILKRK